MLRSLYHHNTETKIHRGAIYRYRPVFWLEPPLWLLRNVQWIPPRQATVYERSELSNAFRLSLQDNQEDIIARAKVRYVMVLSGDFEAQRPKFKDVIVAPTYTVDPIGHKSSFLVNLRNSRYPDLFYLPSDPAYPEIDECYINFRQIQPLHKGFLNEGKLDVALTPQAIKAVLYRYKQFL